ncbi:MAG: hypothetical protein IJF42_06655 [Clostridia bacterium]|nr:hypothetical protein [Clostridia bacterium]
MKLTVDFNTVVGEIKPMHGVGQPPVLGMDFSMTDYLKAARVPFSRLHDVGGPFGGNMFVDIPNIFRDFSADPLDPASYDFGFTDQLIKALMERGIEPFFRLGVTIENYRAIRPYRIHPPQDYQKWAQICEGIIRHYTEGWANGFTYNIRYWEIWNEPDNFESPEENQMWTGTPEDYYRLYEVASKHLKACFPHLKIGGYASCGFYAITNTKSAFAACSPREQYFVDFFHGFMRYIKEHNCPLDFFSWHSYAGINENVRWAAYVREQLDAYGYTETEHTLNEWNCAPQTKGSMSHAALTCGMLAALQNTSLASAMFYDAACMPNIYAGLFDCMTFKPLPAYQAFAAFGELYARRQQVLVGELPSGVYACAAKADDGVLVLVNTNDRPVPLDIAVSGAKEPSACEIVNASAAWESFTLDGTLPPFAVVKIHYTLM